jgi:hypothetical protein
MQLCDLVMLGVVVGCKTSKQHQGFTLRHLRPRGVAGSSWCLSVSVPLYGLRTPPRRDVSGAGASLHQLGKGLSKIRALADEVGLRTAGGLALVT